MAESIRVSMEQKFQVCRGWIHIRNTFCTSIARFLFYKISFTNDTKGLSLLSVFMILHAHHTGRRLRLIEKQSRKESESRAENALVGPPLNSNVMQTNPEDKNQVTRRIKEAEQTYGNLWHDILQITRGEGGGRGLFSLRFARKRTQFICVCTVRRESYTADCHEQRYSLVLRQQVG